MILRGHFVRMFQLMSGGLAWLVARSEEAGGRLIRSEWAWALWKGMGDAG